MLPTRDPPHNKTPTQPENKGLGKNILNKWAGQKSGAEILISDKINFKTKAIKRDTEGHFIILKGRIYEEDIKL